MNEKLTKKNKTIQLYDYEVKPFIKLNIFIYIQNRLRFYYLTYIIKHNI